MSTPEANCIAGLDLSIRLLTLGVLIATALMAWCYHRKIAARRATLDFIHKAELNVEWRRLRHRARKLLASSDIDNIAKSSDEQCREKRFELGAYLSHHEFIAAAIRNKTMDKDLYEAWNRTGYASDWKKAEKYVYLRRNRKRCSTGTQSTRYEHFEELGKEWADGL